MKQKRKKSFTLHRRFRKIGSQGGSMRWHVEEREESDAKAIDWTGTTVSDFDYEAEIDRERRRKVDEVTREGEDTIAESVV